MIVDATAMIAAIADAGVMGDRARGQLAQAHAWHAPAHMAAEVVHAFDRLARRGRLSDEQARFYALHMLEGIGASVVLHHDRRLLRQSWNMRANLSIYDATYVALAEELRMPLLTADARLAEAGAGRVPVVVITDPADPES